MRFVLLLLLAGCTSGPSYKSKSAKQVGYCKPSITIEDEVRNSNPYEITLRGECGILYEVPIYE